LPLATELFSEATLRFALLGMATGALTALVALAVVIVYRVSGVLNFAAPALGSLGAFVCYTLRDDHGWATAPALVIGLAAGTALGLLTWAALALLQGTSLLSRLIATLALLSAAQSAMLVIWPEQTSQPTSLLPEDTVVLFGDVRITEDRLILIGLALVLAVILGLVYRYTLFGLATSAVSESRRVASIARWAPGRIEFVNHLIAGFLAALAAILLAPILTLNGAILSVAILPALAAALVGRFSSFAITVAAALGIGILQSEVSLFQPDLASGMGVSSASLTGLSQAVPLIIILIVAVLSGRLRPARGESVARLPLPGSGRISKVPLVLGIVVGAVLVFSAESYADALITTFGMSIVVASVVVVSGYAGQLSLCQYALAGFGAWAAARAASALDVGFPIALVIGVVATIAVGVLVALPAIRTRGVTLAIVTLALALVFSSLIFQNASLTGGFEGIGIKNPEIFGWDVTAGLHPQRYAGLLLVVLVLVSLVVANLRVGATGRQMIAVRSNERAAAALGINVVRVKVYAFAVGAGIAAIGGILLGFREGSVQFANFNVFGSILLVQYAVIGGIGWISGAVAGAAAAPGAIAEQITSELFPNLDNIAAWIAIFSGIGVVSLLRRAPDGTASMMARQFGRFFRRRPTTADADEAPREVHLEPRSRGVDLAVEGITVRFGGVVAVDDVSFSVSPGEVVGLIGPNGAGKTTLLDVITGFTRQQTGSVTLDRQDVSTWTPERRARAGISRSWQAVELFDELTVRENLLVAEERREVANYARDLVWRRRRPLSDFGQSVVDDLGLRPYLDDHPRTLPHGVTKLVGIARTIISDPSVILLDEPAAGLDAEESNELSDLIRRIAARHSVSIVVIEHDIALILKTCDRIVVLDFGEKIAEGSPDVIRRDPAVIQAYLGEPTDSDAATITTPTGASS
jgi:ABC-type branched-subunit amino acid transport system ATPase component/ABC-type branched-subunit amino acid transport system permease subunit